MRTEIQDLPLTTYASLPDDGKIESAAVFFHGYGADALDLFNLSSALRQILPHTAFYFANAPVALTMFGGYQWFSLDDFDPAKISKQHIGEEFLKKLMPRAEPVISMTRDYMNAVMKHAGVDETKTALCGFSQGGLMALYTALTMPKALAAVVAMSSVALMFDGEAMLPEKITAKPPITLIHGDSDNVLPLMVYEVNKANLLSAGLHVEGYIVPDLMHGIDQIALNILGATLVKHLAK